MVDPAVVPRNPSNTSIYPSLNRSGASIVQNVCDSFVQLQDVGWVEMQRLAAAYCDEHDALLRDLFLSPSSESGTPQSISKRNDSFSVANLKSPLALRAVSKSGQATPAPVYCSGELISETLLELGIGYAGDRFPRSAHLEVFYDDVGVQKRVCERILSDEALREMSWILPDRTGMHDYSQVASVRVLELLKTCQSTEEMLKAIAGPVLQWLADDYKKRRNGNSYRKNKNEASRPKRPFALAWFALWLAERGIWLFPLSIIGRLTEMAPISWACFRYGLIQPCDRAAVEAELASNAKLAFPGEMARDEGPDANGNRRAAIERSRAALLPIRWTSTLRTSDQVNTDFFLTYVDAHKERRLQSHQAALSIALRTALQGCGLDPKALRLELTKYDPKLERRADSEDARAWPWVDDPNYRSYQTSKYYVPNLQAGANLLSHVAELRALLPNRAGRNVRHWTDAIAIWLMFLASLPDADVPPKLLAIDREKHIDNPKDGSSRTFNAYLQRDEIRETREQLLGKVHRQLESFWLDAYDLAKADERPAQRLCPVLVRFDAPKNRGRPKGRTHRRPLDEEILQFVIAENRRNDFEFSRKRERNNNSRQRMDEVLVKGADGRTLTREWFPGTAVLLDVLLNLPFRKKQGRYLDSGEGDEFTVDIESLELKPNALTTASEGRSEAFFKVHPTSLIEHRPVLGMWINTNKTGRPYGVPYIPMDVARNVQRVIDWQREFNPISEPVPDREYDAGNAMVEDVFSSPVFPIFRDPANPENTPVTDSKLDGYWEDLLEHCEKKFNKATGRNISLFRTYKGSTGKELRRPIVDLHSLRVTGITMLIENGVPPEIVQQLAGHASIEMTFYYHVLEMRKVHVELMRALEARAPKLRDLERLSPDQLEAFAKRFTRNLTSDSELGRTEFLEFARRRNPGWDLRYHGICAGGDCRFGAPPEKEGDEGGALWRPEACSLCRYRVTGAPWLVGLVHSVNKLWWELRQATRDIMHLEAERDALEDAGEELTRSAGALDRAKLKRDHLFSEWIAEVNYVRQAKADLDDWIAYSDAQDAALRGDTAFAPALRSPLGPEVLVEWQTSHELSSLTELVRGARILPSVVLPRGILEDRNAILLEIARVNDLDVAFMRLPQKERERSLDAFADMLLDATNRESEQINAMKTGQMLLRDLPDLEERLLEILPVSNSAQEPLTKYLMSETVK